MLYAAPAPASSSRLRNHIRCCPNDNGITAGRGPATNASRTGPVTPTCRATPATVGAVNNARILNSVSNTDRTLAIRRIADNESPPRSKNESSAPTTSRPRTSANSPHRISSTGVAGPRLTDCPAKSGAGNAARSTFPLTVNGIASITTTTAGIMCSGNREAANSRNSPPSGTASCAGTT
jgi:hypothetical protein